MDFKDTIDLEALLCALAQQPDSLPLALQASLTKITRDLQTNPIEEKAIELRELIKSDESLELAYQNGLVAIDGKPLTDWVQSGWQGTEAEVRDIAIQLLKILQYFHHQSLIHRGLNPHNIIRNYDGRVFLVNFVVAKDVYNNTSIKGSTVEGTFGYVAPEQLLGRAMYASDLYGLGATIVYLLTRRSPADLLHEPSWKLSFRSHVNISDHFADWLEKMLEPHTSDRFTSADVALSALQKQQQSNFPALEITNHNRSTLQSQIYIESSSPPKRSQFLLRGDRVVTLASGGAFLGVLIFQIPGAIVGGLLAGIYAWWSFPTTKVDGNS
jgi:Protein kinase domain